MALPSLVSETAKLDAFFWHLSFWACSGDLSSSPGFFRDVRSAAMMLLILFCWQKMPRKSLAMITQLPDVLSAIIHPKPLTSLVLQISPCQLFLFPSSIIQMNVVFVSLYIRKSQLNNFLIFLTSELKSSCITCVWNQSFGIFTLVVLAVIMFIITFLLEYLAS